jgi:hypothetical protein
MATKKGQKKVVDFLKVKHSSDLVLMSVDSQKRARFSITEPVGKDIQMHTSRLVCVVPGLDMEKVSFGENVKVEGKITVEITATSEEIV